MKHNPTVLLLMSRERRAQALEQLEACRAEVFVASDLDEARRTLARQAVDVVLTDTTLSDGDWKSVLDHIEREGIHAEVVVSTPSLNPHLCAEVFNRRACDLLVEPYSREELARVLEGAAARNYMRGLGLKSSGMPLRAAS